MIPLNITSDSGDGVTVLSNNFIDQYMGDANDAQIKVYLYLLRMLSANLPTNITEIADKFNLTEREVFRALSYWEKLHLLTLDYDSRKNIIGIRLCSPSFYGAQEEEHTRMLSISTNPMKQETAFVFSVQENEEAAEPLSAAAPCASQKQPMDYEAEKNSYTAEDLIVFKDDPESQQLIFVAQEYLKRIISGPEIKTLLFIYDRLGFKLDLTDYLLQYCVERGQKSFHQIEQTAILWYESGIISIQQAASFRQTQLSNVDQKTCLEIMKLLGKQGLPAKKEQEYIDKWVKEYAYPMELIEEACNRTVLNVDKNRFNYANSILESWRKEQIHSLKELRAVESAARQKGNTPRACVSSAAKKAGTFRSIEQHNYDFSDLETISLKKAMANK